MKTLELTQDACDMLCKCVTHKIECLLDKNTYLKDVRDEYKDVRDEYEKNLIEIGKLKTLRDYIES